MFELGVMIKLFHHVVMSSGSQNYNLLKIIRLDDLNL